MLREFLSMKLKPNKSYVLMVVLVPIMANLANRQSKLGSRIAKSTYKKQRDVSEYRKIIVHIQMGLIKPQKGRPNSV